MLKLKIMLVVKINLNFLKEKVLTESDKKLKGILMKDDDRRNLEILLNVTGSKGIDDLNCINTLNLVSSDKILKKKDE